MSVFDTSSTTSTTLPTWFSDAQKSIGTTGKTVYDNATPYSSTAGASMRNDLFGTPSVQTYGMQPPNSGGAAVMPQQSNRGPKTEDDWNLYSSMAMYAPGTDMEAEKARFLTGGYNEGTAPDGAVFDPTRGGLDNDMRETDINGNPIGGGGPGFAGVGAPPPGGGLPTTSNPFKTAMDTLQGVASGAANPFLSTGAPNTQTALGGLFAAQNAKLNQILPEVAARTGAGGIGGGNYGGLRGQTAVNTARAGALTTLAEQQNKAALDAQNYAIMAAKGVGDVGSQYSTSAINTANQEMGADLNTLAKYSDIINAMGPTMDKSTTTTNKGSSYENLLKGLQAAGTAGISIDKILKGNTGLSWLDELMKTPGTTFVDEFGNPTNDRTNYEED